MRVSGIIVMFAGVMLKVEGGGLRGSVPDRVYNCPKLDGIDQGSVSYSGITPGSSATYTCNKGCVLSGYPSRVCTERGTWSGSEPSCRVLYLRKLDNSFKNGDKGYKLYSG